MNETNSFLSPAVGASDALAVADEGQPDVNRLQQEYQNAWAQDPDSISRIARAEDIRYARWAGQSWDGLKHQELMPEGKRALPYDRAPDTRVLLADATIQSLVDVDYAAFWNARVKAAPAGVRKLSAAAAGELRQIVSWMIHGPLRGKLPDQVEFASQVMNTIGWVVLHPMWHKQERLRLLKLNIQQVFQLAQSAPEQSVLKSAGELVMDPTREEEAGQLLATLFPYLKKKRAERIVRELRQDGETEFPVPDEPINQPELKVLVPWQDIILPAEATAQPDQARLVFVRKFMPEWEVRATAREEGWSEEFLTAVLNTKGMAMEDGTSVEHDADQNMQECEIVYAYQQAVDEDAIRVLYCIVFSPHVHAIAGKESVYGTKWLLDLAHGELPFQFLMTEVTGRRPADARGVPDVLVTAQQEMKKQRDATYVFSELSVTPPLTKKGTQASRLPPELGPMGIINITAGEWGWFPPPPGKPEIAFKLIEDVRKETQDYFGVPRADTPPMLWQPRQQRRASRNLNAWGQCFWQLAVLAYQNLSPDDLENILGHQPLLSAHDVARHRLLFWFDVRSLDPAWVESLLTSIAQLILPADTAGVVDRAKLMQLALAYLDPTLAEEVTTDQAGAKQAMFKSTRDEVGAIMAGNEGMYVENDPTAKTKLLFAAQIVQGNPEYQAQLDEKSPGFNPRKRELMEKWTKNLQQSVLQQENKTIGRLGVRPGN